MKKIYLLSTEHLEDGLWFRDTDDFKVAMSYVALEAIRCEEGSVLAFILMSNHVHFVLKGWREEIVNFINRFKTRYSHYYRGKYGVKEFLRGNGLDVKEIPYDDEAAERAVAYVLMNCVAAGICAHPSQYPWGTGALLFNQASPDGEPASSYSARALKRMLHSSCPDIPQEWIVGKDGYILPQNYFTARRSGSTTFCKVPPRPANALQ